MSSLELLRRRPVSVPVGAPPAKRIREREDMKKTLATEWLATAPAEDADLVAQLRGLPTSVLAKTRLVGVGRGSCIRDCALCQDLSGLSVWLGAERL